MMLAIIARFPQILVEGARNFTMNLNRILSNVARSCVDIDFYIDLEIISRIAPYEAIFTNVPSLYRDIVIYLSIKWSCSQ